MGSGLSSPLKIAIVPRHSNISISSSISPSIRGDISPSKKYMMQSPNKIDRIDELTALIPSGTTTTTTTTLTTTAGKNDNTSPSLLLEVPNMNNLKALRRGSDTS